MFDKIFNFLPGIKTYIWAAWLAVTGLLKGFAGDAMPVDVDFLDWNMTEYLTAAFTLVLVRLGVKNEADKVVEKK